MPLRRSSEFVEHAVKTAKFLIRKAGGKNFCLGGWNASFNQIVVDRVNRARQCRNGRDWRHDWRGGFDGWRGWVAGIAWVTGVAGRDWRGVGWRACHRVGSTKRNTPSAFAKILGAGQQTGNALFETGHIARGDGLHRIGEAADRQILRNPG